VTYRSYVTPKSLRYIRLYVTDAGIDDYVRLPEFEVIGVNNNPEDCFNGIDDDGDGDADCCDSDCTAEPTCVAETDCNDGQDNDCDGLTDCADANCQVCGAPTAACESISRHLDGEGTLTVTAGEIAGNSAAGAGSCCSISLSIRRPGDAYADSVSFTAVDVATNPNTVYARITQSDGQIVYCTGYVTVVNNPPPSLIGAVSRKNHGSAGDWDINIGAGDIESRSAQIGTGSPNELLIIATFDIDIALLGTGDEVVVTDVGMISSADQTNLKELTIALTDLPLNTQVNLSFPGVVDAWSLDPSTASPSTLCVQLLVGDYDNLGRINFIDFSKVKNAGYINQLVNTVDMARADFDSNARPNFLDFSKVKSAGLINQTAPTCASPINP
jgi:hypothetical protein